MGAETDLLWHWQAHAHTVGSRSNKKTRLLQSATKFIHVDTTNTIHSNSDTRWPYLPVHQHHVRNFQSNSKNDVLTVYLLSLFSQISFTRYVWTHRYKQQSVPCSYIHIKKRTWVFFVLVPAAHTWYIIFCFTPEYMFSSWGHFPPKRYWNLSCDHRLHCTDELMWEQQQQQPRTNTWQ